MSPSSQQHSRFATYVRTLVFMDEPQLVELKMGNTQVVALAINEDDNDRLPFIATTVTKRDWQDYLESNLDLRYLFTYPVQRASYRFDLLDMKNDKIRLESVATDFPDKYLPEARFFATNHTEPDLEPQLSASLKKLFIDGEWDMPDLGKFYNRYSDVYNFVASIERFLDLNTSNEQKKKTVDAFHDQPFKGGINYVHFFKDLAANVSRSDRLVLDKIAYASPGYVEIHINSATFNSLQQLIENFLVNREQIKSEYSKLHNYLIKGKLLASTANSNLNDPGAELFVMSKTKILSELMQMPNLTTVLQLVDNNVLAFAKVVLAFKRRLEGASQYFAQGRMSFNDH
jgi:hypothetical protein